MKIHFTILLYMAHLEKSSMTSQVGLPAVVPLHSLMLPPFFSNLILKCINLVLIIGMTNWRRVNIALVQKALLL